MVAVLSNLSREKSGAEAPMFKSPARARVHIVSKGTARKMSQGIGDTRRAKSWGVLYIARKMKPTKPIKSTNIALRIPAAIFFQRAFFVGTGEMLDGVLMNSPR